MILDGSPYRLSITERMQKIQLRMHLEKISGISAANTELFVAFCRVQEMSGSAVWVQMKEESGGQETRSFDKWNDSPASLLV